jgi:hypothetical protein
VAGRGRPGRGQGSRVDGKSSPGDQSVELGEEATKCPEYVGPAVCRCFSLTFRVPHSLRFAAKGGEVALLLFFVAPLFRVLSERP